MRRSVVAIATSLVVLTLGVTAGADQKKADAKFCAAAAQFHSDSGTLSSIGPQSTVAELHAATNRVDNDVATMQKAAKKMKTPTAKEFTSAMVQLKKDVNAIHDDATLEQVRGKLNTDIQNVQTLGHRVANEAGCPAPQ
jgi:hypothetical protein